jgi:hypothetical protein
MCKMIKINYGMEIFILSMDVSSSFIIILWREMLVNFANVCNIKQRYLTTHIVFLESGHSRLNVLVKCLLLRRTKTQIDKAGKRWHIHTEYKNLHSIINLYHFTHLYISTFTNQLTFSCIYLSLFVKLTFSCIYLSLFVKLTFFCIYLSLFVKLTFSCIYLFNKERQVDTGKGEFNK